MWYRQQITMAAHWMHRLSICRVHNNRLFNSNHSLPPYTQQALHKTKLTRTGTHALFAIWFLCTLCVSHCEIVFFIFGLHEIIALIIWFSLINSIIVSSFLFLSLAVDCWFCFFFWKFDCTELQMNRIKCKRRHLIYNNIQMIHSHQSIVRQCDQLKWMVKRILCQEMAASV